jgi:hypothetical protein
MSNTTENIERNTNIFLARLNGSALKTIAEKHHLTPGKAATIINNYVRDLWRFFLKCNGKNPYSKDLFFHAYIGATLNIGLLTYRDWIKKKEFWREQAVIYRNSQFPEKKTLVLSDPMELLNLPTAIQHILQDQNCTSINDVYNFLSKGEQYLRRVSNLGVNRLRMINEAMAKHDFMPKDVSMTYIDAINVALRFVSYPKSFTEADRLKLKEKLEVTLANKGVRKTIE